MKHDFYIKSEEESGIWEGCDPEIGNDIDFFRLDYWYHNGPQCKRCRRMECQHCHPEFLDEECGGVDES